MNINEKIDIGELHKQGIKNINSETFNSTFNSQFKKQSKNMSNLSQFQFKMPSTSRQNS